MFDPVELAAGVRRVTFPLPTKPWHVHGYLLAGDDGWTLVDTGLALPDLEERVLALDVPIARVVVTHFHPDHVGGADQIRAATGAPVLQGELDYEQCEHVWGNPRWPERMAAWFAENGVPKEVTDDLIEVGSAYAAFIRFARDPERLREGDRVDGWEVIAVPGHADGHIALARDGALVAGDHLLPRISPAVGLYPDSRPDPLADYLDSLRRTAELAPRVVYPGHGDPIEDAAGRAARADRAPQAAARRDRGRPRRRAAHRLRGLVRPLRRRARAGSAPVRGGRDALPPRPSRGGGPRGALARGGRPWPGGAPEPTGAVAILAAPVDEALPHSPCAPENGA